MKKILSTILFTAMISLNLSSLAMASSFNVLPANTPVNIEVVDTHTSNSLRIGDTVTFHVVNNVTVNGTTAIAAGTPVYAIVQQVEKRGKVGRPGSITLGDFHLTLANGTRVPLSGNIIEKAKSKMALSITLSAVLIPFFLFMKGKDAQMDQGNRYTVFTAATANF